MSGGQKQRVSLCRAVYSDADLYILDDVLSAVDAHVGHHIMHECIVGALKDKTRVLVLHQMQWIHHADYVAVVEDGTISHFGTYTELKERGVDFEKYVTKKKDEEVPDKESEEKVDANATPKDGMATPAADRGFGRKDDSKGKLTSDEDREVGKVRLGVFLAYIKAVGPLTGTMIITGIVLYQFTRVGASWWLATWANDTVADETGGRSAFYYLGIYALLCAAQVCTVGMRHGIKAIGQVRAARLLHRRAVWAVFRSPMTWFDMTLTGKIVNRLSSDMQKIDIDLVNTCLFMAFVVSSLVSAMCVMFVNAPFVLSLMPFLLYIYVRAARKYRASVRELVRLESISKSPIYQSFTEALNGLGTIRALRMQDRFCADNEDRLQRNLRVSFLLSASNFWLQVRLSFIGNSFVSGGAAFLAHQNAIGNLSAGIAGLTLTYSSSLIWCLQGLLQAFVGLETSMVSMERVLSYAELTPEAELKVPEDKQLSNWPSKGAIRFENVSLRYRDNLDPVLKNLDIDIQAGHSIGIVGRTGAGKSS
jgi:ATP-binding cassette subfamily C (CFTR/MRP) protein 1